MLKSVQRCTPSSRILLGRRLLSTNPLLPYSFQRALIPIANIANEANTSIPLTKIVATIGPASEQLPMLTKVAEAGLTVMRINFSHATYEEADLRTTNLNSFREKDIATAASPKDGWVVNTRAIMLDTQGPEIRTGSFEGVKEVELKAGNEVVVTSDPAFRTKQTTEKLWISYSKLSETAKPSNIILLDDGAIQLQVVKHLGNDLKCKILNSGTLGNKKGVNMPGLKVQLPAISDKDKEDLIWGLKNNIDFIAASFIRKPSDVTEIQKFCAEQIQALQLPRSVPLIISKIESTEGLENFVDILKVSDAIMIARGDLAVEIPMETLTAVQKEIIRQCNHLGKPVIVATQMLESMQKNPRPTRAEVTDVANAVVDGADCVMLSGESAKGKYPVESVAMMRRIIQETELNLQAKSLQFIPPHQQTSSTNDAFVKSLRNTPVAQQVASIYQSIVAKDPLSFNGVVLQLNSEETNVQVSQLLSKTKLLLPIFLPVSSYKTARLLSLYQGVYPLVAKHDITNEHFVDQITQRFGRDSFQNKFNKQKKKFVVVRESGNNLSYEVL
mmetsp:Transcript_1324/g.1402  ORF Transcript_1324/g.1402 Transcript_1324/m.1402 type:complete len:558 (-) Transcript_1324:81-1754(-)|eukprot:CAMPEP_0173134482 /NCGR_PEP_ID=MMETSP1105-20130129/1315_1 /TAXON_ID=2985 /ORGANISM="Ochromonas sp., Strain BG-1" /LENGTH=557 /DNA_ID=CAMNT_0014046283 /DNA_START=53 /DNA_END=1726 /DNA_ORIENTATION=+